MRNLLMNTNNAKLYLWCSIICLALVYGSLFMINWLSIATSIGLVLLFTIIGLACTLKLIFILNKVGIRSVNETVEYMKSGKLPSHINEKHTNTLFLLFVGLAIGLVLTLIILYSVLI